MEQKKFQLPPATIAYKESMLKYGYQRYGCLECEVTWDSKIPKSEAREIEARTCFCCNTPSGETDVKVRSTQLEGRKAEANARISPEEILAILDTTSATETTLLDEALPNYFSPNHECLFASQLDDNKTALFWTAIATPHTKGTAVVTAIQVVSELEPDIVRHYDAAHLMSASRDHTSAQLPIHYQIEEHLFNFEQSES